MRTSLLISLKFTIMPTLKQILSLQDRCPSCGNDLVSCWQNHEDDHSTGLWKVECSNVGCNYRHGDCYPNVICLSQIFVVNLH
jgi:hypothetical protein